MTTIYKNAVAELLEYELGRIRRRMTQGGNIIFDTSYLTAFLRQRVGVISPQFQVAFYTELMDGIFPAVSDGTVSFPRQTDVEYGVFARDRRKYFNLTRVEGAKSKGDCINKQALEIIEGLGVFIKIMPSESLIDSAVERYRPNVQRAIEEVARRPGVMKESRDISGGISALEEHRHNDIHIMTTVALVGMSDPTRKSLAYTRDSDIRNIGLQLERTDSEGLEGLARKHDFPCSPGLAERVKVVHDRPRSDATLSKMKKFMDAHAHHEMTELERAAMHHRRKRKSTTTIE
ncbi:MAG TPA: hypothetical protein VJK07_00795 [Candidatus Nanoarchaeia archaeon]|nr:hypothetical protein [Candidatus Nanoarchaeia archaeon]